MRTLMISLDKKILDPSSRAAERMRSYGQTDELWIVIPTRERQQVELSQSVLVYGTGGNKIQQFFRAAALGFKLVRANAPIDLITAQDPFFTAVVGWNIKKKTGVPFHIQVHGDFYSSAYHRESGLPNRIRYELGRRLLPRADAVRVVGGRIKAGLVQFGISETRIAVQPIHVTVPPLDSLPPKSYLHTKYPGYDKIFVWLGRMEPVKNLPWLVRVFAELVRSGGNYLLILVGEGSVQRRVLRVIAKEQINNHIRVEPWTLEPFAYLRGADALLFPSLSEGYGLVVMEAQAVGCPVVMSDVGVAGYELKRGKSVRIVPVNDREAFKSALVTQF